MRIRPQLILVMLLVSPCIANGQSFVLYGSAGPTMGNAGYSGTTGIGLRLTPGLTVSANVERTHLFRVGGFRGGTLDFQTVELRAGASVQRDVRLFALAGFGSGVGRQNGDPRSPVAPGTGPERSAFVGGGFEVPVRERLSFVAAFRLMVAGECPVLPIRAGVAWAF